MLMYRGEYAPILPSYMGGVWERLVRTCKKALHVVLHNQVVIDEVLVTSMAEVESLVNSRPLTEVSSDVNDLGALTPNHFIVGRSIPNLPPGINNQHRARSVGFKLKSSHLTFGIDVFVCMYPI